MSKNDLVVVTGAGGFIGHHLTKFLVERAQKRGAEIRLGASVTRIGEGRVNCEDGSEIRAERIVRS